MAVQPVASLLPVSVSVNVTRHPIGRSHYPLTYLGLQGIRLNTVPARASGQRPTNASYVLRHFLLTILQSDSLLFIIRKARETMSHPVVKSDRKLPLAIVRD